MGSGSEQEYASITIPNNDGILIVTYKSTAGEYGVVLMPWGLGSLGFPLKFGGNSQGKIGLQLIFGKFPSAVSLIKLNLAFGICKDIEDWLNDSHN